MGKRYYWLKVNGDFFDQREIKKLRKIAGGDTFTIIYLEMLLLSLKGEGVLVHEGIEEKFSDELALALDEEIENVELTLTYLKSHGLIEEHTEQSYFLTKSIEMIGSESESAERVRRFREMKTLQCNGGVLHCNTDVTKCNDIKRRKEKKREYKEKNSCPNPIRIRTSSTICFLNFGIHIPKRKVKVKHKRHGKNLNQTASLYP